MKTESKKMVKKSVETASSAALGGVAGAAIGAIVTPGTAQGAETEPVEIIEEPVAEVVETITAVSVAPKAQIDQDAQPAVEQHVEAVVETAETGAETSQQQAGYEEVEVVGYERITNSEGQQSDIAVISVNGQQMGIVDANLDGEADLMLIDANNNGELEQEEIYNVQVQRIPMQPLQEAVGFNSDYAQNDMPDYVNDANTDTYMA